MDEEVIVFVERNDELVFEVSNVVVVDTGVSFSSIDLTILELLSKTLISNLTNPGVLYSSIFAFISASGRLNT
jgi:hypothetical protein